MKTSSPSLPRAPRSMASPVAVGAAAVLAIAAASGMALSGCQPKRQIPQETWLVVTAAAAPLLGEFRDDARPKEVIRRGEMVRITKELRPFHWDASRKTGQNDTRDGMAVELKCAEEGALKYGFKEDFAAEASVPATTWLCEEIAGQTPFDKARCPGLLRRARTADGSLLVYAACSSGACPIGVFKDEKLTVTTVESITSGSFYQGTKRSLLLVATRWVKDQGKQSGGSLVPILLENGAVTRKDEIPVDFVDARDPRKMTARLVHAAVAGGEITLQGEETLKTADGTTLSTKPIDEKHPLPSLE